MSHRQYSMCILVIECDLFYIGDITPCILKILDLFFTFLQRDFSALWACFEPVSSLSQGCCYSSHLYSCLPLVIVILDVTGSRRIADSSSRNDTLALVAATAKGKGLVDHRLPPPTAMHMHPGQVPQPMRHDMHPGMMHPRGKLSFWNVTTNIFSE